MCQYAGFRRAHGVWRADPGLGGGITLWQCMGEDAEQQVRVGGLLGRAIVVAAGHRRCTTLDYFR